MPFGVEKLARTGLVAVALSLPSYIANNVVVLWLLTYWNARGLDNIPAVWVGDGVGVVGGVLLQYYVWGRSDRIRKWMGFRDRKCPHCGKLV